MSTSRTLNRHLVTVSLLTVLLLFGSVKAESSFSSLGYGLQQDVSSTRSAGMGLVSLSIPDSIVLDLHTPALWLGPPTARFGMHGNLTRTTTEDRSGSDLSDGAGLTGVAMAVPVGHRAFVGMTISPFTRMDYRWEIESSDWANTIENYRGRGGLSQGIAGISIPVIGQLRIGLAGRAIFGKTEKRWAIEFDEDNAFGASRTVSDRYKGFGGSFSSSWFHKSGWTAGLSINTPLSVRIQRQELIRSESTTEINSTVELEEKFDLPLDMTFGLGKKFNMHTVGIEAAFHAWSDTKSPGKSNSDFNDAWRFSAGWEYAADFRPFDPAWKALTYRGGIYMSDNYATNSLDNQATKYAVTIGLGIPYYQGKSRLDLAIEYGWIGSKEDDGAAERSLGLTVGFNHSELWFVGRRGRR